MHRKILGLLTALVALGAFAAMPAIGSAATLTQTTTGGVVDKVAAGAKIISEGTGTTKLVGLGGALEVLCNENVLTGTVHRNSSGIIEGTIEDAWFQSNLTGAADTPCQSTIGNVQISTNLTNTGGATVERGVTDASTGAFLKTHWCIVGNAENDNVSVTPRNCTEASGGAFRFTVTGALTCGFKREAAIAGTFNTSNNHTSVAELTLTDSENGVGVEFVTDATIKSHSGFCPGSGKLFNFTFPLYTDKQATTPTDGIHAVPIIKTDPLYISSP